MGGLVFLYRLGSLALAAIAAVIVLGLCVSTENTFHDESNLFDGETIAYASLGIATAAMAILSLPIMLFVDFINDGRFGMPILMEIPWLCVLWILFISTGASTKNFANSIYRRAPNGFTCDNFILNDDKKICNEWAPIEIVSWITAGLLFFYTVALIGVSVTKSYAGRSMWGSSVKNSEI